MVTHLRLLCGGLLDHGISVSLAAPADFSPLTSRLSSIQTHAVRITSRPHPVNDIIAARSVARVARESDILHGHGLRGAWIAALASQLSRKSFVFTAHNLAPASRSPLTRFLLRYVVRRAAKVICISRAVAESLKSYGLTPAKTALIPNGIDLATFDLSQRPSDPTTQGSRVRHWSEGVGRPHIPSSLPTFLPPFLPSSLVLSIGRLSPEKGFETLIDAAPMVLQRRPDARFVIAGDGPRREALAARIETLELGDSVHLAGRVEGVTDLLLSADVVVIPSLSEGQGIVALEAMAARKPIVASGVGGLVETVEDGATGLLVSPGEPLGLANAIIHLLDSPDLRAAMGAAGRSRVEAEYTADRMVEQTIQVYGTIVT